MTNLASTLSQYLESDLVFRQVYNYVRERYAAAPNLPAHNFEHTYRDILNAIAIGEPEAANMHIVLCAMALHDIGFLYGAIGRTHGEVGAQKLPEFLAEGSIAVTEGEQSLLQDCLRTHKGSMHGHSPETLEAQVVADADLLEKLGPVGVYQSIRTFTEFNLDAQTVIKRLRAMEELTLSTATGRQMAEQLKPFSIEFADALARAYVPYEATGHTEPQP